MSLSTKPYKGARDFYPEDKRQQKYIFNAMRRTVESFGYEEYDAPILEPTDLFLSKGNEEIIQEQTYTFEDRASRSVTIRTEMTPTVSRMVAGRRQELAYPARWYSIPNLWRYERMQRGRLREFWQLNIDIFGVDNITADFEVIQVADAVMKGFGATANMYKIRLNSRGLIDYLMRDYLKLGEVEAGTLIRLIDRMHKIEPAEFTSQVDAILSPSERESGKTSQIMQLLSVKTIAELPDLVRSQPSVLQLQNLAEMLQNAGVSNASFDITLMRGFDYYTGIVFEVFDISPDNNRAMFGGGRYDGLVGLFGVEPIATVGFGMGDVTLQNFLESHNLLPKLSPETDVYVILIGQVYDKAQAIFSSLRQQGVNLAIDTSGRKLDKQLRSASRKGIKHVMFIGEAELANQRYKLKDLESGKEDSHGLDRLISLVKDRRGANKLSNDNDAAGEDDFDGFGADYNVDKMGDDSNNQEV